MESSIGTLKNIEEQALSLTESFDHMREQLSIQLAEYTELSLTTLKLYEEGTNALNDSVKGSMVEMKEVIDKAKKLEKEIKVVDNLLKESQAIQRNLDALETLIK